jgi:exoribonuclease II
MTMHLLFEEDGSFKAGSALSSTDASVQVELPSGKRTKVKAAHVLLRFASPAPATLIERAAASAAEIDVDFLWEVAPQAEFGFEELAREYYGHPPAAVEAAALLMRLHSAPMYFYRKGRGRYRPAPPETLAAARAAVQRRRQQDELRQQYVDELIAGRTPAVIAARAIELAVRPDRSSLEARALEQAASAQQTTPLRLLLAIGAIGSPYRWHVDSFFATYFPRGAGFESDLPLPGLGHDLPLATVRAFSIDDSATTEIDDAFSVQPAGEQMQIGIHIAAPAVALPRDHPLDTVARARMSTVYAPGLKVTMLPASWVDAYSLDEGKQVPVLSLYVLVERATLEIVGLQTRIERIEIRANLRHDRLDDVVTDEALAAGSLPLPFSEELVALWQFARALLARRERARGRPEPVGRVDYSFDLDGQDERAHVTIRQRRRGAPLDTIVSELMILANSHWGGLLAQQRIAAIYRSQSIGRVKMSTTPAPHEGIGVDHYAWCTSPLRRYVDLVNQRQLLARVRGETPPYSSNDAELFAVVSGFEATYGAYADFQQKMERYWSMRWLKQEAVSRVGAAVLKGDLLRIDGLPLVLRVPGLPDLPRGQRVEIDILDCDELELTFEARLHRVLAAQAQIDEELDDEVGETDAIGARAMPPPIGDRAYAAALPGAEAPPQD